MLTLMLENSTSRRSVTSACHRMTKSAVKLPMDSADHAEPPAHAARRARRASPPLRALFHEQQHPAHEQAHFRALAPRLVLA